MKKCPPSVSALPCRVHPDVVTLSHSLSFLLFGLSQAKVEKVMEALGGPVGKVIHMGKVLEDGKPIWEYGVEEGQVPYPIAPKAHVLWVLPLANGSLLFLSLASQMLILLHDHHQSFVIMVNKTKPAAPKPAASPAAAASSPAPAAASTPAATPAAAPPVRDDMSLSEPSLPHLGTHVPLHPRLSSRLTDPLLVGRITCSCHHTGGRTCDAGCRVYAFV